MKKSKMIVALAALLLSLVAITAAAEDISASSIMIGHRAGASAEGLIKLINDPANKISVTAEDLATLRTAGVPESVITAIQARLAAAPPAAAAAPATSLVQPDHPRLEELVRLVKAGISETIIKDQIMSAASTAELTLNDLLYLKQNGIQDSVIGYLMEARAAALKAAKPAEPEEIVFNDLMFVRGFMKSDRGGRLTLKGDTLSWFDSTDSKQNFEFKVGGLEKVWFTCQQQGTTEVCHTINFKIVKGESYAFRDLNRTSGSNAAIVKVMDTLKSKFPKLPVVTPEK